MSPIITGNGAPRDGAPRDGAPRDGVPTCPSPLRAFVAPTKYFLSLNMNDGGKDYTTRGSIPCIATNMEHLLKQAPERLGLPRQARRVFLSNGDEIESLEHAGVTHKVRDHSGAFLKNRTQLLKIEYSY